MRLATLRVDGGTTAVRVDRDPDGDVGVDLGEPDVGAVLARSGWREWAAAATGRRLPLSDVAPLVPRPSKIICVGLNYRNHILEMGRELPRYPTLFAKFTEALIGPYDDITLPSEATDWEAELAVVIGATVRRAASDADATSAIAGFTVFNDVTARDWQNRTPQWLQGKTFEGTTPLGPYLVTPDEAPEAPELVSEVDGEVMQRSSTAELVFPPAELVRYISQVVTLRPGDVIATGTPGGVGHARRPPRYLTAGSKLVTRIEGIGELVNVARRP